MATSTFLRNRYWMLDSQQANGMLEEYKLASEGVNQARLAGEAFLKASVCLKDKMVYLLEHRMRNEASEYLTIELKEENIPLENVRICYSPFSRTSHTAKVVASALNIPFDGPQCKVIEEFRERFFGPSFELMSHDKYLDIWALDERDPFMPPEGGESVADVVSRLTRALGTIESEFQGCAILVVSHGDPLQILQTILNAAKQHEGSTGSDLTSKIQLVKVQSILSQHRKFALLTGELRAVV
ncbi:hypothetical protein RJ639_046598 [Escallonia herrerae]|uniref:Phosphoglycerate mutase n=1 Tax=Escallonia herrerae TaxID=1293975 RepID=A0AA89B0V5_9ASTE|nr:hypothetical protein RJ639_046598 [Escallonia herrerae]